MMSALISIEQWLGEKIPGKKSTRRKNTWRKNTHRFSITLMKDHTINLAEV